MRKKRRRSRKKPLPPLAVGQTIDLTRMCKAITRESRRCSRPATTVLGGIALCDQHANTGQFGQSAKPPG